MFGFRLRQRTLRPWRTTDWSDRGSVQKRSAANSQSDEKRRPARRKQRRKLGAMSAIYRYKIAFTQFPLGRTAAWRFCSLDNAVQRLQCRQLFYKLQNSVSGCAMIPPRILDFKPSDLLSDPSVLARTRHCTRQCFSTKRAYIFGATRTPLLEEINSIYTKLHSQKPGWLVLTINKGAYSRGGGWQRSCL